MEKEKKGSLVKYVSIFSLVIIIWLIFMFIMFWSANDFEFSLSPSTSLESLGVFGDSFNILTSLFTGLAFAGVIISVILQTKELEATREELSGQRQAIEKQNFENTFFNMLKLHNNIVNDIEFTKEYMETTGGGSFSFTTKKEISKGRTAVTKITSLFLDMSGDAENPIESFIDIYDIYSTQLGHYFRNIYHILKLIENFQIENKKFYSNILRAQLSNDELILLYFNGLTKGKEKAKPLFEKYEFFEPLELEFIKVSEDIIKMYDYTAYGENKIIELI